MVWLLSKVTYLARRCFYCQDRDSWSALSLFDQPHFLEPEIWEIFAAAVRSSTGQGFGTKSLTGLYQKYMQFLRRYFPLSDNWWIRNIWLSFNNLKNALNQTPPRRRHPPKLEFVLLVNISLEHSHVLRCWLVGKDCKVDRVAPHSISQQLQAHKNALNSANNSAGKLMMFSNV